MKLKGQLDTFLNQICKGSNHCRMKMTDPESIMLQDTDVFREGQQMEEMIGQIEEERIGQREEEEWLQKIQIPIIREADQDKVLRIGEGSSLIWTTDE